MTSHWAVSRDPVQVPVTTGLCQGPVLCGSHDQGPWLGGRRWPMRLSGGRSSMLSARLSSWPALCDQGTGLHSEHQWTSPARLTTEQRSPGQVAQRPQPQGPHPAPSWGFQIRKDKGTDGHGPCPHPSSPRTGTPGLTPTSLCVEIQDEAQPSLLQPRHLEPHCSVGATALVKRKVGT